MLTGQNITGVREGITAIIAVDIGQATATMTTARFVMQEDRLDPTDALTYTQADNIAAVDNTFEITLDSTDTADLVGTDQIVRNMVWQLEANLGSGNRPIAEGDIEIGRWA